MGAALALDAPTLAPGMKPNPGRCPAEAIGKRVVVQLANGSICGVEAVSAATPTGWAASTTRWSLAGQAFDVVGYRVLG